MCMYIYAYIYIYIHTSTYMCICICGEREREREIPASIDLISVASNSMINTVACLYRGRPSTPVSECELGRVA